MTRGRPKTGLGIEADKFAPKARKRTRSNNMAAIRVTPWIDAESLAWLIDRRLTVLYALGRLPGGQLKHAQAYVNAIRRTGCSARKAVETINRFSYTGGPFGKP